jgi:hypothetical protein
VRAALLEVVERLAEAEVADDVEGGPVEGCDDVDGAVVLSVVTEVGQQQMDVRLQNIFLLPQLFKVSKALDLGTLSRTACAENAWENTFL